MPTQQAEQAVALLKAQAASRESLATAAEVVAVQSVRSFAAWYDTASITRWSVSLAAAVQAYQRQTSSTTNAYLLRLARLLTGRDVQAGSLVDITGLRAGVTLPAAYGRVADAYRFGEYKATGWEAAEFIRSEPDLKGLATPGDLEVAYPNVPVEKPGDAITAAVDRTKLLVDTDMSLAVQHQAREFMKTSTPRPIGWRRMIHPELSKGGVCGLCIVASHRVYHSDELMPLHGLCKCVPMQIYAGQDPGSVINASDLARFYEEAGSNRAEDLKRTRYQVHQHGELGPQLRAEGDTFRSKRDVKKAAPEPSREQTQRALALLEQTIGKQRDLAAANPALAKMIAFNENRIVALRKKFA